MLVVLFIPLVATAKSADALRTELARCAAVEGVAIVSVYPPNVKYVDLLREVQILAEEQRVGLWAVDAFACTPAEHRAGGC